uniref:IRG-type G domain-containing protein n=1 Tax=Panagrolaimus davidi TaxID=227884 RepID=A0A914PLB2_9BILA
MGAFVSLFRKKPQGEIRRRVKVPPEYEQSYYDYDDIHRSFNGLSISKNRPESGGQPRQAPGRSRVERGSPSSGSSKPKPQWEIVKEEARRKLGLDTSFFNFGISGHTKTGKSSLINAILNSGEAAMTDVFEATESISHYNVKSVPNVVVWDIPGSGTRKHGSGKTYFMDKCLYMFDCLIILTQDTITEEEIGLAKLSLDVGMPVIFVRSRCDMTLMNLHHRGKIAKLDQDAADNFVDDSEKLFSVFV